jgi:tetratricopeptide (TPR) repeat protein
MEWRIFFERDKLAPMIGSPRRFPGVLLVGCLSIACAFAQGTNDESLPKYAEQGQRALANHQYAEAEKNYVAMEKLQPSVAEIHATLGVIYYTEKKFDKAVDEIRQAEKLKPGLPNLSTLLALSLSELGQYEEALPNLETGFQQSTEPSVRRMCGLQLMRGYYALQRDSQAVDVALKMDAAFPNDPEVLYQTSRVYGNSAFLNMQKLRREAPNSVWRHLAAAEAYESQGQFDDAISEYRQVLVLDPRRLGVHYRIGRTLLARSRQANSPADIAEARKEFEAELALDPRNGNATYELAEIYRNAGDLNQAQKLFENVLEDYSGFEEAHLGLAAVLMAQQKPQPAKDQLEKAIALNPGNEVSWYRLAQVDRSLGDLDGQKKALVEYQQLRQKARAQSDRVLDPANEVTRQELDPSAK